MEKLTIREYVGRQQGLALLIINVAERLNVMQGKCIMI